MRELVVLFPTTSGALLGLCLLLGTDQTVLAQSSSLLNHAPSLAQPMQPNSPLGHSPLPPEALAAVPSAISGGDPSVLLNQASWTYQPAPPVRVFRVRDIVTIRVDEITRLMAEGRADARRQTLYRAILNDWIQINDFRLRPNAQPNGDPAVAGQSTNVNRNQSRLESREALSFSIAAMVVDIRPNGNLVLEARKNIRVNDNLWETALTGICRPEDIAPDNVVLSRDLIDLEIQKEDQGHLRDGYKRGWFSRWFDRVQPF